MSNEHDKPQDSPNPYASPSAAWDDAPQRRSSRFRILPTALLWIFASLSLLSHVYAIGMIIFLTIQEGWFESDFEFVVGTIRPLVRIPAAAMGIGVDVVGIMAARHCWQGRWLRSAIEAAIFIGGAVLANVLIFSE